MGKLLGLILLVLDIMAIVDCFKSNKKGGEKILWTVIIIVLPLVGLIAYYLIGKKK